ncbi:MAG: 16S rRNA (uracil(1498)-N(3))-methyltransferase [Myxococcota bacterium]
MNLVLFTDDDLVAPATIRLTDRRARHIRRVHRAEVGEQLVVGRLHGDLGQGTITRLEAGLVEMDVAFTGPPPPPAPVVVILALPRPKGLRRMLEHLPTFGVEQLILVNAFRVEKSYWSSPLLAPETIEHHLRLGLEQARDTRPPIIQLKRFFRPFVEDELPAMVDGRRRLLAHPAAEVPCPHAVASPVALAIGPEGGWIDFELNLLQAAGFERVHAGPRILRTEAALPHLLGRILL